ncbi:hypothetical protein G6F36_013040 [Rhizopus arrhizus]|nr:hypothetical protein G6F36_013040 [Rhizopus arrhizus]
MFIKNTRNEIQDSAFKSRKYADSRGSKMFFLLSFYDCKSKSVQINEPAFWKEVVSNKWFGKFIFKKKPKKVFPNDDKVQNVLILKDFTEEIKNNEALVWTVDLGATDMFTIFYSGSSPSKEKFRKIFTKEYYHMCGVNLAAQERMQHQQYNQENFRVINETPTLKTPNLIDFSKATSIRLQNYQRIMTTITRIAG